MRRNLVLVGLRDRKLEAIHEEFQKLYFVRVEFFLRKHLLKMIGKVDCHQHRVCG